MRIKINGISYVVEIHQQDENKVNLILLHGFMGSGRVFDELIPKLKPFCNPVTIDLLGHGKTDNATSSKRFQAEHQIEDVTQIIQEITDSPPCLYGYSMGGRLALQMASNNPKWLQGIILESTNPGLNNKQARLKRIGKDKKRAKAIKTDFEAFLKKWKSLPLFKTNTSDEKSLEQYHHIQRQQNPLQMTYSLRGFGTGEMPAVDFNKIAIPSLLVAGKKDDKYVQIMSEMNEQNAKSELKIIPEAGHRVHIDNSDALTKSLDGFLG